MLRAVRTYGRLTAKAVYRRGIGMLRKAGIGGFARQMIDVDTLLAQWRGDGLHVERWTMEEPPRSLVKLPLGDEIQPLDGVRTTISLLDITDSGFSIRNGYLVDPELRVVYEKKIVPTFDSLRIGLERLEKPQRVRGAVGWLWNANNYAHWLLYALSLVRYYRSASGGEPDYYYVGAPIREYQLESLEMIGVSPDRVVTQAVQADRLLVAIRDRMLDYDSELLRFAAEALLPPADSAPASADRRLFLSRAEAAHRRLLNEAQCARALQDAFGFDYVSTAGMKLTDEIELFRHARLVVGAHGAGFTNIVFSPPGTAVIELASTTYWDTLFAQIAALNSHPYAVLRGEARGLRAGVPPRQHDFEIDVARLVRVVGAALETHAVSTR